MTAAVGITTSGQPPTAVVNIQPGMNVQPVVLVDQNGNYVTPGGSSTTAGSLATTTVPVNVAAATAPTSAQVLTATSGTTATWQALPTGTTSAKGVLQLDGTAGDIQAVPGTAAAGASGLSADAQHVHPARITVPSFPQTYTGGVVAQTILAGPTVTPVAGEVWEWDMWAQMTTTADTQTVTFQAFIGGNGLVTISGLNPNSGSTITNAATRFQGKVLFPDPTHSTAVSEVDLDYYFANASQQGAGAISPPGQLTLSWTPSATGLSLQVNGGYWRRIG